PGGVVDHVNFYFRRYVSLMNKHCTILTLESFARQLDQAVARFQIHCKPVTHHCEGESHLRTRDLYALFQSIGHPMDYRQVTAALVTNGVLPAVTSDTLQFVHARLG